MKKDIKIPEVTEVFMAIVKEYNPDFRVDDWNVYLINNKTVDLEVVLIVSQGYDDKDNTSIMRKKIVYESYGPPPGAMSQRQGTAASSKWLAKIGQNSRKECSRLLQAACGRKKSDRMVKRNAQESCLQTRAVS